MDNDLAQEAVSHALKGNWKEAIKANKLILKNDSNDIDSLNRLARAHAELGSFNKARLCAKKVLKIDPFNNIATRSLKKWKNIKKGSGSSFQHTPLQAFLEEPGKTKIVSLIHLGGNSVIANLDSGDKVKISNHGHRVTINTADGKYIGRTADDLSSRLRRLMSVGYDYAAYIKSTDPSDVRIFIKEIERPPAYSDIPSFSSEKIEYISFTPPELVHKKEDLSMSDEDYED